MAEQEVSRAEQIAYHRERQNAAQSYNADMAKWILASLLAVNGGPFLILTGKADGAYVAALAAGAPTLATGLALAVLCGFFAWLNTGMREAVGGYTVERLIEHRTEQRKAEVVSRRLVKLSYALSIFTGFGSLAAFLGGALVLNANYSPNPGKITTESLLPPAPPTARLE